MIKITTGPCSGSSYGIISMPMSIPYLDRDLLSLHNEIFLNEAHNKFLRVLRIRFNYKQIYIWRCNKEMAEYIRKLKEYDDET